MAKTSFTHLRIWLIVLIVVSTGAYLISRGLTIWHDHRMTDEGAKKAARSMVRALDDHAARTFGEADQALLNIIDAIQNKGGVGAFNEQTLHELFLSKKHQAPQIGEFMVIDSRGKLLAGSGTYPVGPVNVSEKEYFIRLRDNPDATPFISRPFETSFSKAGSWRVMLARAIINSSGEFQGVAAIAIVSDYFNNFYSSIDVGEGGFVDLVRRDGYSLIHQPFAEIYTTINFIEHPLFTDQLPKAPSGTYFSQSPVTFKQYLRSYRTIPGFPLIAVISLSKDSIFKGFQARTWRQGVSTIILLTLVSILSIFLFRHLRKLENAEAERDKVIGELQEALAQVKTLKGLLPICAHCKRIRDDQGYWNILEKYFLEHSEVAFSHSICPECLEKHYSSFGDEEAAPTVEVSTAIIRGKGKILVMDNEKSVRGVVTHMLEKLGYEAVCAQECDEAFDLFRKAQDADQPFSAAIFDLTASEGMGGKEVLDQLLIINPNIKIVVSSGHSDDLINAGFIRNGAISVINKPYRFIELSKVLNQLINTAAA